MTTTTPATPTSTTSPRERAAELLGTTPTGLLVGGAWRDASDGGTFAVENPASGETLTLVAS
ncbi:NAD-dependent succinate-semialdehyde dehydrogenase, partial [Isoptericola sp. NPDC057391]